MLRILVISGIFRTNLISKKRNENDILLVTERHLSMRYGDLRFSYIFTLPYSNRIISLFSLKWREYWSVIRKGLIRINDKDVFPVGLLIFPRSRFRFLFYKISFYINRQRIDDVMKTHSPTVIHAQNADWDAFLASMISKRYNIPYIVTARGMSIPLEYTLRDILSNASHVIALSPMQYRCLCEMNLDNIAMIPHGVEQNFYDVASPKFGCKNDSVLRFVSVCRLLKLKNIHWVIQTLSKFDGEFVYDIYGSGPEVENLQNLIESLNLSHKVKLVGNIDHKFLPARLVKYDLFVMPSYPETLGRVYLEAMACGLPVLGTKDTGIDGIIVDGKHGFLVDRFRSDGLFKIFQEIFLDPDQLAFMGKNALELAKNYSWDNVANSLYSIYRSCSYSRR